MRNFIVLVILLVISGFIWKQWPELKKLQNKKAPLVKITPTASFSNKIKGIRKVQQKESIFVPDWSLTDETILHNGYNRWIYFGGEEKIMDFVDALKDKELWITVKVNNVSELTDSSINDLYNKGLLKNFKGVVLDLEINGIATKEFITEINSGVKRFSRLIKEKNLKLAIAVYGDVFYRKRPLDLEFLNKNSDEIMIMAYDFSKSYGEPGANYPYQEFKKMVGDFLQYVPAEKLTFIYGMYGYDWKLKDQKPLEQAEALTLNEIKKKFLGKKCYEKNCLIVTQELSKEKHITFDDDYNHSIFFEDEESAGAKTEYLKENGIGSIAYWAWGYF